jgi:winged helix DNA-binding protein
VNARELNRATLARQGLLGRVELDVADAAERLGGLQAQEPRPPFIALWSRLDGFRREDLGEALHEGSVVRATLMRATLHIMSAADFATHRATLQPCLDRAMAGVLKARGAAIDVGRVLPAARKLLKAGPLTFNELRAGLAKEFPEADERALGYAVRTQVPLVMVPTGDAWSFPRDSRFTLADGSLGKPDPAGLVLRHLAAFGPASVADVQRWSGLQGLKPVLEGLREQLVTFKGTRELFDLPGAPRPGEDAEAPPRFLADFDSLVLAHDDRTRVIADEHKPAIASKNLRVPAMFLWDGFAAGTWRIERKRGVATLTAKPFAKLQRGAAKALEPEALALLEFAEPDAKSHAFSVE